MQELFIAVQGQLSSDSIVAKITKVESWLR